MVGFGGWNMPVQYAGIMQEHQAVRNAVGVFDISHMGEFFVSGPTADCWLDGLLTNRVSRLGVGEGQYTFLLNDQGGVIDDLIVYRIEEERFLLVVNAAKIDEDWAWVKQHATAGVELQNASNAYAGLAIQGPKAEALFTACFGSGLYPARNHIITLPGRGSTFVARTGYTGEDGFELFCPAADSVNVFQELLTCGAEFGLQPCGLGARDTLRLEMCYPLNGSDLSPTHTPLEAGLGFFVDLEKGPFIGRDALLAQKAAGLARKLVPFKMQGTTPPPRPHYKLVHAGEPIGEASSGTLSPSLGVGIGMAYLPAALAKVGQTIEVEIRGKLYPATVEKKPFYRRGAETAPAALVP